MAEKLFITVPEFGEKVGLSRNAAYEAAKRGEIPTVRIGRRVLVPADAPERLALDAHLNVKRGKVA